MYDATQKMILHALLDRYEKSTFFRERTQPTRRIMLNFYNGGKTNFPYYDIEKSERRIEVNRAVLDLCSKELLAFSWMAGEENHIIASVWLNIDHLDSAYAAANCKPKGDIVETLSCDILQTQRQVNAPWARNFLQDAYDEIQRKRDTISTIPADHLERSLLFKAIIAMDRLAGAECMERVFSLKTLGDSKLFERTVKPRLLSVLRKYFDSDDDVTDEDILKQVGIVKYPEQFEFCGNITFSHRTGSVEFNHLPGGSVIYSSDLSSGNIIIDPSIESVITIENRANYIDYIQNSKTLNELVIYHGGQYSPRKRIFLQTIAKEIPKKCKWYHWSDIDYGGFTMLSRLRREITPEATAYHMGIKEFQHYEKFTATIKASYAEKLVTLKAHPELHDCYDCIDYMIQNKVRLEQEAMLVKP